MLFNLSKSFDRQAFGCFFFSVNLLALGSYASTPAEKAALKFKRRGLLFDEVVNVKSYEDKPRAEELSGIRRTLHAAEQAWSFDGAWPELEGTAHSLVVADDKCIASLRTSFCGLTLALLRKT